MIKNILQGSWPAADDGHLSVNILRQVVSELNQYDARPTARIRVVGPDGRSLQVKELQFEQEQDTPPPPEIDTDYAIARGEDEG